MGPVSGTGSRAGRRAGTRAGSGPEPEARRRVAGGVLVGAALALVLGGCAGVRVSTELEPGADLSEAETWAHAPGPDGLLSEPIRGEIARALEAKGYQSEGSSADLLVRFSVEIDPRSRLRNAGDPDVDFYVREEYYAKEVEIEIFDRRRGTRVWRGVGELDVFDRDEIESAAAAAVRAVLEEFPPRAGEDAGRS